MRPITICLINQKGGCGKSSICFHLAGAFAQAGEHVLLVDADPQGSLSQGFFGSSLVECLEPQETLAALFQDDVCSTPEALARSTSLPNVTIVRANQHLAAHNTPCPETTGLRQFALQSWLGRGRGFGLGAGRLPAESLPVQLECLVGRGFRAHSRPAGGFWDPGLTPGASGDRTGSDPESPARPSSGTLSPDYDRRLLVHQTYEQKLRRLYGSTVLDTVLPEASAFKVSLACRQPVSHYAPRSQGGPFDESTRR